MTWARSTWSTGWARRIYGERVGLLAAALMAVAVSHIQLAHFSTFDVITTFFITLSLYGSVRVIQAAEEGREHALADGVGGRGGRMGGGLQV